MKMDCMRKVGKYIIFFFFSKFICVDNLVSMHFLSMRKYYGVQSFNILLYTYLYNVFSLFQITSDISHTACSYIICALFILVVIV